MDVINVRPNSLFAAKKTFALSEILTEKTRLLSLAKAVQPYYERYTVT